MKNLKTLHWVLGFFLSLSLGCAQSSEQAHNQDDENGFCARPEYAKTKNHSGSAHVFLIDPIVSSLNTRLSPGENDLNAYTQRVHLAHLSGRGILHGKYAEVVNGSYCQGGFGAQSIEQNFEYPHEDPRFQESMSYYYADKFQTQMRAWGYIDDNSKARVIAHCNELDNAFFTRISTGYGGWTNIVCLGTSSRSSGAFYSDDASVLIHELAHGITAMHYSVHQSLTHLWYDEGGLLNEALSDFAALVEQDEALGAYPELGPRMFGRWALGAFDPKQSNMRGAHRCPSYDSEFPTCQSYPSFTSPSSANAAKTSLSYIYPDGLGWPYPKNFHGANPIALAYTRYELQEEVHSASILMTGTLWDIYQVVKSQYAENVFSREQQCKKAKKVSLQLFLEALRHLPLARSDMNASPVSLIAYAKELFSTLPKMPEFTDFTRQQITQVLKERGLLNYPKIESDDWLGLSDGNSYLIPSNPTKGVYILTDMIQIRAWFKSMHRNTEILDKQKFSTGLSYQLNPGQIAAVWFDLENKDNLTAGGVLLSVQSLDEDLEILDERFNIGYLKDSLEPTAQIVYGKINGKKIVEQLNGNENKWGVPLGNSYFKTNPFFFNSWRTAIWVRVKKNCPHNKILHFALEAKPTNGVKASQIVQIKVQ